MVFPIIPFLFMLGFSLALTGIMYLLRPKQGKGDVFDSKTYHLDGMQNSVDIGTPVPVANGTHKFAPHILNYYIAAKGDYTKVWALCSFGEGTINGLRDIRINNQSIFSLFASRKGYSFWLTLGESRQKVYGFYKDDDTTIKTVHADMVIDDVTAGFNKTIKYTLDTDSKDFEAASASEPGYIEILKGAGPGVVTEAEDIDNIEIVQYTGKATVGGVKQLTGCRVTKDHYVAARLRQTYRKVYNDAGALLEVIPGMNKTVVKHQEVDLLVTQSSSVTKTTENKVEALGVVVSFKNGLYKVNKDKGSYEKTTCKIKIKWWKDGESWSGSEVMSEYTRTQTADAGDYIRLEKKKNYAWLVDANGAYKEGVSDLETTGNLPDQTDFDKIEEGDTLEFTLGGTTYYCEVVSAPSLEPTGRKVDDVSSSSTGMDICRYKVKFKQLDPAPTEGEYNGPKTAKVSFTAKHKEKEKSNVLKHTFAPDKAKLAEYRWTFLLPDIKKFGKLDYAKYKVMVEKEDADVDDAEKGQNLLTFIELQEINIDHLSYPHEALLGLEINTNEKISGTISNITAVVEGRLLKDVQNTGNPDRLSTNPYDFFADSITNKRYGRGKDINLSASELTDFYAALAPEAAHADHAITENSRARKRFELNTIIDFKKPTIDLLRALAITYRGNIYWDGVKPLCFTDRTTAPTAMFGPCNIVPGSFKLQSLKLAEQVNRIYSQFLSKAKNWTHDSVSHDFRDEGFTMSKLKQKEISLYGITDGWRASKIDKYLLRLAKYVEHGIQFTTTNDAVTTDIGKTFYYFNKNSSTGRILAIGSNYITLDRAFTIESGKTYKTLIRKDDGTPHAELTVDNTATGIGSKTVIYFTGAISGTTLASCPIYGMGLDGKYHNIYRCAVKNAKGNEHEIVGSLYNAEVYRLHKNDTSDPAASTDTVEYTNTPVVLESEYAFPPNVLSLAVKENNNTIGSVDVHVTRPPGMVWSYCEITIRDEDTEIDRPAGVSYGEPVHITGLKLNREYTVRATSYSKNGRSNPNPFEASITLEGTEPPVVSGLKIINNKGTASEVFGRDFEVRCDDMTTDTSHTFVKQTNENEGLRYLWQVYYSGTTANGIPDSVKLGGIKVNTKEAYRLVSRENIFKFSLENNIERIKAMYASHPTDANYATYYGNPRREVTVKVSLINAWGKQSPSPAELVMVNPPPDMKDASGVVITPTLRKIKGGLRIEFTHPDKEYDIVDYIVRLAKNAAFTSGLKRVKITSSITTDSSDDDIADANYKTEIDGLDSQQTYYVEVIPRDPFGKGTASNTVSSKPGITNDDDELDLARPSRYDYTKLTVTADTEINDDGKTVTNLIVKGEKASETDVDGYVLEVRMVKDTGAATPPTGAEIDAGITGGGKKCEGNTYQIGIDGEAGTGTTDTNNWKKKIPDIKNNWSAFFRARKQNTSGQKGAWSSDSPGAWVSFVTTKANNAADTTSPAAPTVAIIQEGQAIGITASITTPPADLQGFQFAVKSTAFSSDADRLSNKHADIDASAGKAKDTFYGVAGSGYYISARSYDFSKNFSAWVDYASNPVELAGLTLDSLSEPISMAIYTGAFTAADADTVTWENNKKVKIKRTGGTPKEYTITGDASTRTTGNLTGTRYIVFNKATSTSVLSVVTTPGDDDIVIAKVSPVTSGKANILRFVGNEEGEYSISRFSGGFNQLSAIVAEFGRVLMVDGGYTKILIDSTQSPPVIRIAKDGYNATETDPDKLRWSSEWNYFKEDEANSGSIALTTSNLPAITVDAGKFVGTYIDLDTLTNPKNAALEFYAKIGDWIHKLPSLVVVTNEPHVNGANYSWFGTDSPQVFTMHNPIYEWWKVDYAGVSSGRVVLYRFIFNLHTAQLTSSAWNATIYWKASAETL
mgnify:FL=1